MAESSAMMHIHREEIVYLLDRLISSIPNLPQRANWFDELEDQCSSIRAVVGDPEIQKLMVSKPNTLVRLTEALKVAISTLDQLSHQKEVRNILSPLSPLKKRRAVKVNVCSVLGGITRTQDWIELESCILNSIKGVNRQQGTTNYSGNGSAAGGRESDQKTIIDLLLGSSSTSDYVPVLTVFGPGGLGKSKLAQSIFDDTPVVDWFEWRLWVYVGEEFDVKTIVEKIIECIVGRRTEDCPIETLKDLLGKLVCERKFLLILDDVLNEDDEKWNEVMECLKEGGDGSRILVVTRHESIADRISTLRKYELKGLSLNESLSLWDLDVPEGVEPLLFEQIKDKILSKCDQNPLEIELIGKVLRYRPSETELLPFMFEVLRNLDHPTFQLGMEIGPALPLSYGSLPPQLKKCFLYCGLFPKDKEINVEKLIHLWMAQQIIIRPEGSQESVEEIGLEYLKNLIGRSFLKEGRRDELGNIKTCQLHNLMHDLATSVASFGYRMISHVANAVNLDKIRTQHVSFLCHFNSEWSEKALFDAQHLRTFLLPSQEFWRSNERDWDNSFFESMFTELKHLYVCDLHSSGIVQVPSCIKNLKCLRYLDLSENDEIKSLPDSITKLHHLQVLNVSGCEQLEKLPKRIRKLVNLRHLYCHNCWNLKYMPRGIGELIHLRTISWFVVAEDKTMFMHSGGLEELGGLKNLSKIQIRNLKYLKRGRSECEKAKLKEKEHLQLLALHWNHDDDDDENAYDEEVDLQPNQNLKMLKVRGYIGVSSPVEFSLLRNLVHISIKNCEKCKHLPPLDHIETLEYLSIENLPCLVFIDYNEDNASRSKSRSSVAFFKSLKELHLLSCPNLKGWLKAENDSASTTIIGRIRFPSLSVVDIQYCPNLSRMPSAGKAGVGTLQKKADTQDQKGHNVLRESAIRQLKQFVHAHPGWRIPIPDVQSPPEWETSATIQDVQSFPAELLKNLNSFQKLHINRCPKLEFLPRGLQRCTSLQELEISQCPLLKARCGSHNGADWPIIAHIPYIQIDGQFIKWDGIFQSNLSKAPSVSRAPRV